MTQLILYDSNNVAVTLPETSHDRFQCYPAELGTQLEMISGRIVREIRGHVQMVVYQYDYFPAALWRDVAAILRSGASFTAEYLPDDSDTMVTSTFICTAMDNPVFAFSRHGLPYWHGIKFTLREVSPHD